MVGCLRNCSPDSPLARTDVTVCRAPPLLALSPDRIVGTLLILWLIYTIRDGSYTPREESFVKEERRSRRSSNRGSRPTYVNKSRQAYRVREPSRVYLKPE